MDDVSILAESLYCLGVALRETAVNRPLSRRDLIIFTRTETNGIRNSRSDRKTSDRYPVFAASTRLLGFRRLGADIVLLGATEIGRRPFLCFLWSRNPDAFSAISEIGGAMLRRQAGLPRITIKYSAGHVSAVKQAGSGRASAFVTTEKGCAESGQSNV